MVRKLSIFFVYALMATACLDEPECFSLNNPIIGLTFRNKTDGKASAVSFLSIKAVGSDSAFTASANKVFVPVNYFKNETTFYFVQATTKDTLQLGYKSLPQFVSADCGERYVLSELKVIYHSFDSIHVVDTNPAKSATINNVDIFIR